MSLCSVGPRVGGAAVRIGACRKAEAVSPKANPPRAISEAEGGRTNPPRATPKRCVPKSGSGSPKANHRAESPKQKAEESTRRGQSPKRKAEEPTRPAATPNRYMPKSGSSEPEGQPAQRQSPKRCVPKSGSGEPEGQLAQRPLRIGACRKAEAVNPKANHRAEARLEAANPSGENHPRRAFAIRRSKPRNEGSAEQCRHTYQYNRKTRL